MFKIILCRFSSLLFVALGLGVYSAAMAVENMGLPYVETTQYQRVKDLDIYYGVMPVQIAGKSPATRDELLIHGGVPANKNEYHFVVALFDASGKRITDAKVTARVRELGMVGVDKTMEPMQIGDVTSFGNYFELRHGGIYRLEIGIRSVAKQSQENIEAIFEYRLQ
jgi:hypothetical protein